MRKALRKTALGLLFAVTPLSGQYIAGYGSPGGSGPSFIPYGTNYNIASSTTVSGDIQSAGGTFTVAAGQTLTFTGHITAPLQTLFVLGSGASVNLGTANSLVPVEWFGAVGDYIGSGSGGTDNTVPIQNCFSAMVSGQCLLQAKKYKTTGVLTINKSAVGLRGTHQGAISTTTFNQLAANVPASAIYNTSTTADTLDVVGVAPSGTPVSFNTFEDFTLMRTALTTVTGGSCAKSSSPIEPSGLAIEYAGGWVVNHVWSEDSFCNFYFINAGAFGTGAISNSGAMWGFNGFEPTEAFVVGYFIDGTSAGGSQENESMRMQNDFAYTNNYSSGDVFGILETGTQLSDLFINHFEDGFTQYGIYLQELTGGSCPYNICNSDIHIVDSIFDTYYTAGILIDGLNNSKGSTVEINGGWNSANAAGASAGTIGIRTINSATGVTVTGMQFLDQAIGIEVDGGSRVAITGNSFFGLTSEAVYLNTASSVAVTGNIIYGNGSTEVGVLAKSLTRSSISGNSMTGTLATGISLDSASNNNSVIGVNAIDPTAITTPDSNAGTGNNIVN